MRRLIKDVIVTLKIEIVFIRTGNCNRIVEIASPFIVIYVQFLNTLNYIILIITFYTYGKNLSSMGN